MFTWLKNFFASRKISKIEKSAKLVANPKAIKEDRFYALEYLAETDDAERCIPALLQRFNYSLEHGINDGREKEIAEKGIVKHGDKAIELVADHLKKTTRIAWPIKILIKLCSTEKVAEILLECLNFGDVAFDQAIVDRNYDLLCYLADYVTPEMIDKISHFLRDPDERVRFAAAEALANLSDPKIAAITESFIADFSAENRRVRKVVMDLFMRQKWSLKERSDALVSALALEGLRLNASGFIER